MIKQKPEICSLSGKQTNPTNKGSLSHTTCACFDVGNFAQKQPRQQTGRKSHFETLWIFNDYFGHDL
jgi:hypothetical protein